MIIYSISKKKKIYIFHTWRGFNASNNFPKVSLSSSENALLAGPITVSGTVTVPSGSTVTIV